MKVEALCYSSGPSGGAETVFCRLNSDIVAAGDLPGTSLAYAERADTDPKLIFLVKDHDPVRGNVYVLATGEAYRVETIDPVDVITRTANCVRLTPTQADQYVAPND